MHKKPVRTLFITQSKIFSGAEVNLLALLNTIDTHKVSPYLCFDPASGMDKQDIRQNIQVCPLSLPPFEKKNVFLIAVALIRLLWILMRLGVDLVYVNVGTGSEFKFLAPVCRLLRLPIILHLHIHEDDASLSWIKADRADRILFPSKATMEAVLETSPWLDREKCFFVHNGIDLGKHFPRPIEKLKNKLAIANNSHVIGIIGQLKKIKGQHLFLEMVKSLSSQGINAVYLIVGCDTSRDKEYEKQLRQTVIDYGIENMVKFLGFRNDIPDLMSLCDLLVVPSIREPFGRVVIEAMACGTPVVASAVGGIVEIFKDGEGGLFCQANDVDDLTEKVKIFFDNPVWWEEQKKKAIATVKRNFTQEKHTKIIESHILKLLGEQVI
ncbi:hypothetical protein BuS5_00051 [Desulfosarcina sp. BuS5]|uniref:glycosyltransferase family 4 protein n=1 Tax=Desulfosarcina sp. BuS5 TaxID=933262 RepID=UPI000686A1E0|nr:glycosyltransferase family 4 protein [Desulfosarcina sp. BuS5]WDN87083.1 hypothetical protein BuS5_00051 [Desulfosarcina sp. BuS5]